MKATESRVVKRNSDDCVGLFLQEGCVLRGSTMGKANRPAQTKASSLSQWMESGPKTIEGSCAIGLFFLIEPRRNGEVDER